MKETTRNIYEELFVRYPILSNEKRNIGEAFEILLNCVKAGGTIFVCGNGGSASDSEHIVGELMKMFKKARPINREVRDNLLAFGEDGQSLVDSLDGAIPAISLTSHLALSTAFSNDKNPMAIFAQQLYGLGKKGDCLLAISTSGNSKNCVLAMMVAKAKNIFTVALAGKKPCKMDEFSNVAIHATEQETFKVQELHLPIYHALCAMLENELF